MIAIENQIETILAKKATAPIRVQTLGNFQLWRNDELVDTKEWGRDVSLQLFQFFITSRHRRGLHKEQIIDRIWDNVDAKAGQQNFKVAHHGVTKVLEPDRENRVESKYIIRQGATYQLKFEDIWIDIEALDQLIALGHQALVDQPALAQTAYREAIALHQGVYLPNRLYEDWSSEERERIQLLILGAFISLSELLLKENPLESVRLTQLALQIDPTWEDAYRIQMEAYLEKGNRPMAIKTFQHCERVLEDEFGIAPLPETRQLYQKIKSIQ
ncbi:MAG: bacterial transcriptional activator domain-containing protein [Saprospiraceae bacterium]